MARQHKHSQEAGRQACTNEAAAGSRDSRLPRTASDCAVSLSRNSMAQPQQEETGDTPFVAAYMRLYLLCYYTTLLIYIKDACMGTLQCWEGKAMCV